MVIGRRVIAAGREGVGARSLAHSSAPDACWSTASPPGVVGVRLRVQEHFDVLDVEAELRDARHDESAPWWDSRHRAPTWPWGR